ncbi:ROK family protein [Curtobacterium sp. MCJR17_055]|uniref:ROK family protein n=1 Tax=unclassified Curtobacterium TaxID=257496 RepID=UPI000D9B362F|nr:MULTISPECIES: ROK family protein [unclassified Curtobacterium]PYY37773.1 ROK family protein [Curtobacterium sp. MCBD17_029]PYY41450.1 ROK family protein [Curtobacterium sp. MCPF17_046]PYY56801.1 ROK family protein [Curtobacterium sp. MCJR17_055]PYY62284.1 ROK family protein [Curtobacterium sp. MCPF17_015]PZE94709.1 ROK family protein [Curtobacterium sp. MCBD17_008]
MTARGAVLGVDVGGTGIKARLTADDGLVLDEQRVPTPRDDPAADALAVVVAELAVRAGSVARQHGTGLGAVGLVVPGVVDEAAGRSVLSVNLGWQDVPVRQRVAAALRASGTDVPLAFGHDVRAGALAEVRAGGLDRGTVAFVPVGTGLASALVVDGRVVSGDGWAGEIGQVRIPHGPLAGLRVEEVASAGAVARRCGVPTAHAAMLRVRDGELRARQVWDDCVDVLTDALAWLTAVAGCHTLVIGGGLAQSGPLLLDPLTAALTDRLVGVRVPAVVGARHGDAAGAIGAGLLAEELLERDLPTRHRRDDDRSQQHDDGPTAVSA